jgi:hypothetical protein
MKLKEIGTLAEMRRHFNGEQHIEIFVPSRGDFWKLMAQLGGKAWRWVGGLSCSTYVPAWVTASGQGYILLSLTGHIYQSSVHVISSSLYVLIVEFGDASVPNPSGSARCFCPVPVIVRSYIGIGSGGEWVEVCRACKRERG